MHARTAEPRAEREMDAESDGKDVQPGGADAEEVEFERPSNKRLKIEKSELKQTRPCFAMRDKGRCFRGDNCQYSHDPSLVSSKVAETTEKPQPKILCLAEIRRHAAQQS